MSGSPFFTAFSALLFFALAAPKAQAGVEFKIEPVAHTLSTAQIWEWQPSALNPQAQTWSLRWALAPTDLRPIAISSGIKASAATAVSYGVITEKLWVQLERAQRPVSDPTYGRINDFSCHQAPDPWFSLPEGSSKVLGWIEAEFKTEVKNSWPTLQKSLARIKRPTPEAAMRAGASEFSMWRAALEKRLDDRILKLRKSEWAIYQTEAKRLQICDSKGRRIASGRQMPTQLLNIPPRMSAEHELSVLPGGDSTASSESGAVSEQIAARVPARWVKQATSTSSSATAKERKSLLVVRAEVVLAGRSGSGNFVIDPSQPESALSSAWLEQVGFDAPVFSGLKRDGFLLSDDIKLSGYAIGVRNLKISTDLSHRAGVSSVDGVLGADFFRAQIVEILAGDLGSTAPVVLIWRREGFPASYRGKLSGASAKPAWVIPDGKDRGKLATFGEPLSPSRSMIYDLPNGRVWVTN